MDTDIVMMRKIAELREENKTLMMQQILYHKTGQDVPEWCCEILDSLMEICSGCQGHRLSSNSYLINLVKRKPSLAGKQPSPWHQGFEHAGLAVRLERKKDKILAHITHASNTLVNLPSLSPDQMYRIVRIWLETQS